MKSAQAQPYFIGTTSVTFYDPSRGNRAIDVDIFYPAVASGNNTSPAGNSLDKFPVVVFGHGFVMTTSAYQNIWSVLVPAGYIVALPKTEGSLFPNHTNFGKDLAFVATSLQNSGATAGNLFYNKVASQTAVMGHSMGGGASFLAVQYNSSITTVIGLAPAETNPAASAASQTIAIPALIFAGGNDCVTPAGQHSQLIYSSLGSNCKNYINIIGGSHCQFANSNFNCSFGESTCSPGPSISRSAQHNTVMNYLIPYLNYRLKNNCAEWFNLQTALNNDTTVTYLQTCNEALSCITPVNRQTKNITTTSAKLSWKKGTCVSNYEVRYRKSGNSVWTIKNTGIKNSIQINSLQSGSTYDWQVRVKCDSSSANVSSWGSLKQFTTSSLRSSEIIEGSDLPEIEPGFDIIISPNPSTGVFQLSIQGEPSTLYQLEIIDILGTLVDKQNFLADAAVNTLQFNLNKLSSGIYFLRTKDGKSLVTKKLIIN